MEKKGHTSKETLSSNRNNLKRIERVIKKPFQDWKVKDFEDYEGFMDKLVKDFKLNTVIMTISALKAWLVSQDASSQLIEDYEDLLGEMIEEKEDRVNDQEKTDKEEQLGEYFEWPKLHQASKDYIKENLPKAEGNKLKELALLGVFSLQPPARLGNYVDMEIVEKEPSDGDKNYLVLKDGAPDHFVFQKYKTAKYLGRTEMEITDPLLAEVLTKQIESQIEKGKTTLFPGQSKTLSTVLSKVTSRFLPVGISLNPFRHSFLTYFMSQNPSINEKVRVTRLMGQKYDVPQAEKYARK